MPSYYGECSSIGNCIVADGCILEGNVNTSILFRQVTAKAGSNIDSCVIMNDTIVEENCQLKYVILDKDVTVRPGTKLIGAPANPIIVKRGEMI